MSLDEYPHLKRWFADIRARPQVQKGVALGKSGKNLKLDTKARERLFGMSAASSQNQGNDQIISAIRKST